MVLLDTLPAAFTDQQLILPLALALALALSKQSSGLEREANASPFTRFPARISTSIDNFIAQRWSKASWQELAG